MCLHPYFSTDLLFTLCCVRKIQDKDSVALVMAEIKKEKEKQMERKEELPCANFGCLDRHPGSGHSVSLLYKSTPPERGLCNQLNN